MIPRHGNWQTLQHEYTKSIAGTPFAWGAHDCCLHVVKHIEVITGVNVGADFAGKYTDQKSAFALIKSVTGGSTVEDVAVYIAKKFAIPELTRVNFAQRGDVVSFTAGNGQPSLGIVHLDGKAALFVSETGLNKIDVAKCARAWRIGATHPTNGEVGVPGTRSLRVGVKVKEVKHG